MSTEYFLVSDKEAIWVASDGLSGFGFLSGEPECMRALNDFLERNKGATFKFLPEHIVGDMIEDGQISEVEWAGREAQ